ncbi:aminodeoxychorismate synthase component I [Zhongshania guokunii]|uniref:aminodeoxychorismate synthase n=1 Tax=Zhongshania guokunii TaxID=641783 RepID=A0ABV3U9L2_9GAMM
MASLRRIALPYTLDSSWVYSALKKLPLAVYLDSAAAHGERGHWDVITADPIKTISLLTNSCDDIKKQLLNIENELSDISKRYIGASDLPFTGGAIGYLSYDFGEQAQAGLSAISSDLPLLHIGIYPWAVIVDHQHQRCELVAQASVAEAKIQQLQFLLTGPQLDVEEPNFKLTTPFTSSLGRDDYARAFSKVKTYIDAGDCYQINLTREFSANYSGEPWAAYLQLREVAAAPFSAYMDLGPSQILCLSPERLLSAVERKLQTQPIKGTAARSNDPSEDQALATALLSSAKNRAENIMIVDLLRNDFSKSCRPDSVVTESLCELQSFRTVHHLVSTVSGYLRDNQSEFGALLACFPGGSITGAPKQRAMEIIREIEPHRRSAYCGSIFYLGAEGKMDSNIAIRSFVCHEQQISAWAGGGIVADSQLEEEFVETETKISKLLETLANL